jgi:hypothetical protein
MSIAHGILTQEAHVFYVHTTRGFTRGVTNPLNVFNVESYFTRGIIDEQSSNTNT